MYIIMLFWLTFISNKVFLFTDEISKPYKRREIQYDLYIKDCKKGFIPTGLKSNEFKEKKEFETALNLSIKK